MPFHIAKSRPYPLPVEEPAFSSIGNARAPSYYFQESQYFVGGFSPTFQALPPSI